MLLCLVQILLFVINDFRRLVTMMSVTATKWIEEHVIMKCYFIDLVLNLNTYIR